MNDFDPLLLQHVSLVIKANETTNITRIDSLESAKILHIEDSLAGLPELLECPDGLYGDIGSGAGFPGIPLAIESGRNTVLIESIGKKAAILESMIGDLGLSDRVSVYSGRVEELAVEKPHSFSVLSARAVSQLSSLMELASPLLMRNGRLICYKAQLSEEELQHALDLRNHFALHLVSDRTFTLSDGETQRRIIVFKKKGKPKVSLPRRNGMAQRKPY